MRQSLLWYLTVPLIVTVAEPVLAADPCSGKGVFALRQKDGTIEYCWYGTHYTDANAPAKVRNFFAEAVARRQTEARDQARRQTTPTARPAAPQRSAPRPRTAASVATSAKPVAAPIDVDLISSIETGTDGEDVIAKLGKPHGSIANLGEEGTEESWSYRLSGGGMAKVRLDQGKVIAVQFPQ